MLPEGTDYEQLYSEYRWEIPEFYNIGVDVCDKWAAVEPSRLGLIHVNQEGVSRTALSPTCRLHRLANLLSDHGIEKGGRVGILLPQSPETAYGHIAAHKVGGISVSLFTLFGVDALKHRLAYSATRAVITDWAGKDARCGARIPARDRVCLGTTHDHYGQTGSTRVAQARARRGPSRTVAFDDNLDRSDRDQLYR